MSTKGTGRRWVLSLVFGCVLPAGVTRSQVADRGVPAEGRRGGGVASRQARLVTGEDAALGGRARQAVVAGSVPTFRVVPVQPPPAVGGYPPGTIINDSIGRITIGTVPQRIWFETRFSGWGCCGEAGTVSVQLGPESELQEGLRLPDRPCTTDADCAATGYGGPTANQRCGAGEPGKCGAIWQDSSNPLIPPMDIFACNQHNLACGCTLVTSPSIVDMGQEYYSSTSVLEVEPDFVGAVELPFQNVGADTFLQDGNGAQIPIQQALPATVVVAAGCCIPGSGCFPNPLGNCAGMGGTPVEVCRGDCNNNGIDDACQGYVDCNNNGQLDFCDVTDEISEDCNRNFQPDECESPTDCDANGVQDICDIADQSANDCNWNAIPDPCDIDNGLLEDDNGDDVPDVCQNKSRFLTFAPPPSGTDYAVRLKFIDLHLFSSMNGQVRWLNAPAEFNNGIGAGTFWASSVGCAPALHQWPGVAEVSVSGSAIVPDSVYEVRFADAACLVLGEESCMTPAITLKTTRWGDVLDPFYGFGSTNQPNPRDFAAIIAKFKDLAESLHYTRARIAGNDLDPSQHVNFMDISACVSSHQGFPYPYAGPASCP